MNMEELLAGYVLGNLTPEEVAEVNELLISHPELLAEITSLQETLSLLPLSLPEASPSPSLRSRLLAQTQVQVERESTIDAAIPMGMRTAVAEIPQLRRQLWSSRNIWLAILGSLVAIYTVGLGIDNYRLRQELASARSDLDRYRDAVALLRQPDNRLLALKGMGATPTASGSITIAPSSQTAMLVVQNLSVLPKGKVYRLWAMSNGQKIDCAEFVPDAQGKVLLQIPLDRFSSSMVQVAITIEPSQRTQQPTGEMVMIGGSSI
jgi:anti-sigma-K factor RskA